MSVHLIACQCEFVNCQWFAIYALTFKYLSVGPVASQWIYCLQSIFISSMHQLYQVSWYKLPFVAPSRTAVYYPHHWALVHCINIWNMECQWNVTVCVCFQGAKVVLVGWTNNKSWQLPAQHHLYANCSHTIASIHKKKKEKKALKATQSIGLTWAGQGRRKSHKMLRSDVMSTWGIQQITGNKSWWVCGLVNILSKPSLYVPHILLDCRYKFDIKQRLYNNGQNNLYNRRVYRKQVEVKLLVFVLPIWWQHVWNAQTRLLR